MVPAGRDPEPPGSGADEAPPAGTALAPADRHHPAGVLQSEIDSLLFISITVTIVNEKGTAGDPRPISVTWTQPRCNEVLERDAISFNRHPAPSVCLSMSFSQNPLPLLRDML
jgi:hypothetical protein